MKTFKRALALTLIMSLTANTASAVWYNPLSWFGKKDSQQESSIIKRGFNGAVSATKTVWTKAKEVSKYAWKNVPGKAIALGGTILAGLGLGAKFLVSRFFGETEKTEEDFSGLDKAYENEVEPTKEKTEPTDKKEQSKVPFEVLPKNETTEDKTAKPEATLEVDVQPVIPVAKPAATYPCIGQTKAAGVGAYRFANSMSLGQKLSVAFSRARQPGQQLVTFVVSTFPSEKQDAVKRFNKLMVETKQKGLGKKGRELRSLRKAILA